MKTQIFEIVAKIVKKASGIDMNKVDITNDYISLGFDSLVVVRIDQEIRKQFNLEIDMGLYYDELDSLSKLLDYIAANIAPSWVSEHRQPISQEPSEPQIPISNIEPIAYPTPLQQFEMPSSLVSATKHISGIEKLLSEQMRAMSDLMHRQLDVLGAHGNRTATKSAPSIEEFKPPKNFASSDTSNALLKPSKPDLAAPPKPKMSEVRAMKFDPDKLNELQQEFLDRFIPPYIARTKSSKEYARKYRDHLADWINTLGFRRSIKEIVYPIVSARSLGSRVWDIDGNEYIDIAMGYGVNLFGHAPKFVTDAIQEQLERGFDLGPQNRLVGEVASLISEMTGMDRVAFCNTGSEAVMMALRAAQALTKKDRVALFMGSYHGNSDLVIKDTLLLRYGEDSALTIIRENAHELAAVLVEPVQSRNPSLQPKEFLHKLRELTKELGIILIFDEMINGFRSHPGGAQAIFGVRADMATYGKVPAGGMPIGIVAGSNECMKVIDGGLWDYGDDSVPGQEVIFFGGTFCKHPLTMAAAHASLLHMKNRGAALQDEVNRRTEKFANEINQFFQKENIAIKISWFASQFIFEPTLPIYKQPVPPPDMTIWFHLMMSKGIYTWERRVCFFSEAHTDDDVRRIVEAIKESSLELKEAGFPLFGGIGKDGDNPPENKKKTDESTQGTIKNRGNESSDTITLPMTQAQQQLWFLAELNENAIPAYIETVAVRLSGKLDRDTLSKAASDLVARHAALRTVMAGDGKNQKILPTISCEIEFTQAPDILKSDGDDPMQIWLKNNSQSTFDLVNGPLFSFKLLELDPNTHILAMNFHHIVMDGRSVNVILRDLISFYSGRLSNHPFDPEPAPDLRAYQSWLEGYLSSEECKKDQEFWTKLFPETIPMVDFPTDRSRPSIFTFKGARHHIAADPAILSKCFTIGRSRRLTPFMTMISLYTLWLHKLTGRDEVVIGFPVGGRFFPDSDDLVGYCTHLVPFVSRYDANLSFSQYLDRSRESLTSAYRHQKYPFGQLIRNLQFEQDLSRGSVIASEFNLDQVQDIPPLDGLTLSLIDIPLSYVKYDFNLEIMEVAGQYQFKFEYATDLFEPLTIARISNHFMTLINGVCAKPEEPLRKISLLTEDERYQMLTLWNQTDRDFALNIPFHRLFEEQVSLNPDRVAASFSEPDKLVESMTYRELNGHANRLAYNLKNLLKTVDKSNFNVEKLENRDLPPLIPILAERSCRFLVAIIGIFKAGCAYLPLDPEHPADRISTILNQVSAPIVLAEKQFSTLIESSITTMKAISATISSPPKNLTSPPHVIWFEESICHSSLTADDEKNLPYNLKADSSENLAYIIFTSGSTGLPKGAMVQQKGMVNHIYAKIEDLGITKNDVVAQNASQCFDISVWQFLAALLKGGRVEIMNNETAHDPNSLLEVATKQKVTILEVVPSLLRVILENSDLSKNESRLSDLRWLVPTGEALPPSLCIEWFKHYPHISVLNAYGPTECSDDVAHYCLNNAPAPNIATIPIGRPVANMRLYILDQNLEPVPIGVAGELWVGGVGVGLGYLNRADLTAKSFIPDPFNPAPNARLYRTGDLAQFLPDGNILFLGREDHQVKIRGFRIELGEIEATLARNPMVKELVVTASQISTSNSSQTGLTAYVVFNQTIPDAISDANFELDSDSERIETIRTYLSQRLPNYMVPAYFVPMDKLPLTPNGKIDRKALPNPTKLVIESAAPFEPPRNDAQRAIAEVLSEVLNRTSIGIYDNYFSLGGDSIQAIQAVARIQARGYALKLRDIFQYPTVAELAPRLTRRSREIDQKTVTGSVAPTPLQRWLISQNHDIIHHYNQAITLHFKTKLEIAHLQAALESIMLHHDALRLTVKNYELNIKDIELKPELIVAPFEEFKEVSNRLHRSIDIANGPLLKSALFKGKDGDSLLLVIHHLTVDAVSWQILVQDIVTAYNAHSKGDLITLPAKTDSFQYWSNELNKIAEKFKTGSMVERKYWEDLSKEPVDSLPIDFTQKQQEISANPNGLYKDSEMLEITLPAPDTSILMSKAHTAYHTDMNDLILTALAKGLRHWGNINAVLIALEGHGRDSIDRAIANDVDSNIDVSRTVGWFTTLYPVMLKLPESDAEELGLAIKQIKESLHSVPNRGFNFGLLYPLLNSEIQNRLEPSISFNYLGVVDAENELFRIEPAGHLELIHQEMGRQYTLEIEAEIRKSQLHIEIYYSKTQYQYETIRRLGAIVKDYLIQIIDHCSSRKIQELTPSDFTWKELSLPQFGTLLKENRLAPTEIQDIYPLTPMQENMLFHRLYSKDSAYFEQFSFSLNGQLNLQWFEMAWNIVTLRHDILRTNFIYKGVPRPLQVVKRSGSIDWHYEDISTSENPGAKIENYKIDERQKGFELDRDILMRMNIFKIGATSYAAIWSYHHILMDGWCLGLLIQDVQLAYMDLSRGKKPQFTPAPQYREYISWLEEKADHDVSLSYWSDYLEGFTPITSLPRDLSGDIKGGSDIQSLYSFGLNSDLSQQLSKIAKERQITINTLVQSIWGLLLAEANGVSDVVFGAAVSGRPASVPNVESIVGLFLNSVPVRVKLPDTTPFGDIIRNLQSESLAGEPHHFISLASIQSACGLEAQLLDHVLIFQNYPLGDELEELQKEFDVGFKFSDLEAMEQTNYDLSVEIYPMPNIHFDLRYNSDVYSTDKISSVSKDITILFEAVAKNPDMSVRELRGLLTSSDELGAEADFLASAMNIDDEF
ncbi:MAG: amino acid adenylation domain-containing protein [Desulfamplus sp.]|nr:amino acid adenylation domain-containing protein [Desulfamplus sp.]